MRSAFLITQGGPERISHFVLLTRVIALLALIDGPGLKDDVTGKVIASYAHPIFWAPFIVVGESGGNANRNANARNIQTIW
jgi:hypothetical protein